MAYLRDTVIVLRHEPYREHDGWITMYGREHGKLVAVARGVRKPQAKHLGHLEPLSMADVLIAKGASFDKVAVARRLQPHRGVQRQLAGWSVAGAFADFLNRVTRPGVADASIYQIFLDLMATLDALPAHPSPVRASSLYAASVLRALSELGYAMDIEACADCRALLRGPAWWSDREVVLVCDACSRDRRRMDPSLTQVAADVPKILRFMHNAALSDVLRLTAETASLQASARAVFGLAAHAGLPVADDEAARFDALLSIH